MRISVLGLLFTLSACGGGAGDDTPTAAEPSDTDVPTSLGTTPTPTYNTEGVTFYGDVEPILRDACVSCHQSDGVGSFPLESYEDAQPWAQAMAAAASDRRMPPWLINDDGTCQDWADSKALSQEAIDTLVAWADNGAPQGDPADGISEPLPDVARLQRVDTRLDSPEIVPENEDDPLYAPNDEYRCFVFKNVSDRDTFITGFEIDPGFEPIVHHVIGMTVDPNGPTWSGDTVNSDTINAVDGADGRPGWDCLGTAGYDIREKGYPVTWAPGMGAVHYPEGTGVRHGVDDWFVAQIHYNLIDPANLEIPDSTGIQLRLDDEVEHELYFALADGLITSALYGPFHDVIPPGEEAYEYEWSMMGDDVWLYAAQSPFSVGGTDYKLWGVMPHMHQRGVKQYAMLEHGDGSEECIADVPQWDFEWQLTYFYEEPVDMAFSDRLHVSCTYDTSEDEAATLPGWGTNNEMCLLVMMISK